VAVGAHVAAHPALSLIGNTPLVEAPVFAGEFPHARILAKMEAFNPGGSVKDRPVRRMLLDAIASGKLRPGMTILDSSSGNAGIAYAMIGRVLGYDVEIVLPRNASAERQRRIAAHGATMTLTDPSDGYDGALREVRRRYEAHPARYFFVDQYSNASNWQAHYDETATEVLAQAPAGFTHFLAGVGTGGTLTGVARRLEEVRPDVQIVAVAPEEFPGIEGLKPLGPGHLVPAILDRSLVDRWIHVTADESRGYSLRLAQLGFFVGQSSGAYMAAARRVLLDDPRATIVTLFPDIGERYFSTGLWDP